MKALRAALWIACAIAIATSSSTAEPRRDNLGDQLRQLHEPYRENAGLEWDGQYIWGCVRANPCRLYAMNPETGEIVHDYQINQEGHDQGLAADAVGMGWIPMRGEFWINQYVRPNGHSVINRYDRDGNHLGTLQAPAGGHVDFCTDGQYVYANDENDYQNPHIYKLDQDANIIATGPDIKALINHGRALSIEYVPAHDEGHFWVMSGPGAGQQGYISQLGIDFDADSAWVVQEFRSANDYPHEGLCHDGYNLWAGGPWDQQNLFVYDDGIIETYGIIGFDAGVNAIEFGPVVAGDEVQQTLHIYNLAEQEDETHRLNFSITDDGDGADWLAEDPTEGTIDARQSVDITLTANTQGLDLGEYNRTLTINSNDAHQRRIEMNVHLFVVSGFGRFSGTVTDATSGAPIEGAIVSFVHFGFADTTDANGAYEFPRLPAFDYILLVTKPDFLPIMVDTLVIEPDGDLQMNFPIYHSVCSPRPNPVNVSLPTNDHLETVLTIGNTGNGPLTWAAQRVFPQEHQADPWALRHTFNAGANLHDDRIEGVAFDGEHFYFAGANAANPNTIYVTDRDGNEVTTYTQLGVSQYGMKDLEWDGELLWGSGEQNVYGFRPNGDSVIAFRGPYNPNNNIAYDSDDDLLWISGTTTNISAYDRAGNAANRVLNRKGLRMYGMAYWPEDPDGYKLYIFDTPSAGFQLVHKMNTQTGDTLLAYSIPTNNGEAPSGAYITNLWDPYSWVMLTMQNIAPANGNDRLAIWHLGNRTDWVLVSGDHGVIPGGESTDLTVSFNSAGMPVDQHLDATLHITHDGVGGVTDVPLVMNITAAGGMSQRIVSLTFGWNLVSVNVNPQGAQDFTSVVQPLVDQGLLLLAKDEAGNFYLPGNQFNNINGWNSAQSYWLKMNGDAQLQITGVVLRFDTPIDLASGWNNVSYLPRQPVDAATALSGLGENLTIARDGIGRFYLPAYNFSDIGQMTEGAGYQLRVQEAGQLVYSLGGRGDALPSRYSPAEVSWLNELHPTNVMHNLLVKAEGLAAGTRLEALTPSGLVAGRGVIGTDGLAGLTLWGDDPTTETVEGFKAGEEPTLRFADPNLKFTILNLKLEGLKIRPTDGSLAFSDGGWGVVEIGNATVPSVFSLSAAYPNPFNSTTRIGYSLASDVKVKLGVYDLAGRRVAMLFDGPQIAGTHNAVWKSDGMSSGVYICRLQAGSFEASAKLILIK